MFGAVTFVALCAVLTLSCQATAHLRPPTNLSSEWIDHLTVKVSWSWKKPKVLPKDCHVRFELKLNGKKWGLTSETHFLDESLTESSDKWIYSVRTVPSCKDLKSSGEAEIVVEAPNPRAEMTDFKCYLSNSNMDCSWTPDPKFSLLSLSYRECGPTVLKQEFKQCVPQTNLKGPRKVCRLEGNFLQKDLCMVAVTPNRTSTFKAPKALRLPKMMKILEEGTNLVLMSLPLEVEISSSFYNICYSVCDKPRICFELKIEKGESKKIPYDKSCQYKFQYRARSSDFSTPLYSDWSEERVYGSSDPTLTVVAILIPIILSFCVILSCICFRRHKDIICPDVPDPSTIFKEMINGNKEIKHTVFMYMPVQEPIQPIVIVPHIPPSSGLVPT